MMQPVLICEAALHGDGNAAYYLRMIETLHNHWTGWPKLVFKMQHWTNTDSEWARLIECATGRQPLLSVNGEFGLHDIAKACKDAGFIFMSTPHDLGAVQLLEPYVDWFKLGAFDATQPELVDAVARTGKPTVISISRLAGLGVSAVVKRWPELKQPRLLNGVSAYPANEPWFGLEGKHGYSCHSVPSLIEKHVLDAAKHCQTIEVHVTTRSCSARPLPADMCVSLDILDFIDLATEVGSIWKQSN